MPDVYTIKGTTFRFPTLPADGMPSVIARETEKREKILAAARRPRSAPKRGSRVSLLSTRPAAELGSIVSFYPADESVTAEVQAPGPTSGTVWAVRSDSGEWVCLSGSSRYGWSLDSALTSRVAGQRQWIVRELAERDGGYSRAASEYRYLMSFRSDPKRTEEARNRMEAEHARALWDAWQSAYPNQPFDFALVSDRNDLDRRGYRAA